MANGACDSLPWLDCLSSTQFTESTGFSKHVSTTSSLRTHTVTALLYIQKRFCCLTNPVQVLCTHDLFPIQAC